MISQMTDTDKEPGSGPFCQHYGDPSDCDEVCSCGHRCALHSGWEWACDVEGCACEGFQGS